MAVLLQTAVVAYATTWCVYGGAVDEADAAPLLPDVDSLFQEASDTVSLFNTQASRVQDLIDAQQKASKDEIMSQKTHYESELAKMKQNNSNMVAANDKIRSTIQQLRQGNENVLVQTNSIQRVSQLLRDALISVHPKMNVAKQFISDSLNMSNLTGHKVLQVLEPAAPEPTLEHFLAVARGALDSTEAMMHKSDVAERMSKEHVSLLEMSGGMKVTSRNLRRKQHDSDETPEDLVQTLSDSIVKLDSAQEQGLTELKAHYIALSEVGTKRYQVLAAEQQALNQTRANMVTLQGQLQTAKAHVWETINGLKQRINGIRLFAQKMNETAAAAIHEAREAHPFNHTVNNVDSPMPTSLLNILPSGLVSATRAGSRRVEI